jgi:hypothetical protein
MQWQIRWTASGLHQRFTFWEEPVEDVVGVGAIGNSNIGHTDAAPQRGEHTLVERIHIHLRVLRLLVHLKSEINGGTCEQNISPSEIVGTNVPKRPELWKPCSAGSFRHLE